MKNIGICLIAILSFVCLGTQAQNTQWLPAGEPQLQAVKQGGEVYIVTVQQVRARCASHQMNDCESRVIRADVIVERVGGGLRVRKHRVCETAACKQEDLIAFVRAALSEKH